jgi:UDP-glucuronate 4-epimerase
VINLGNERTVSILEMVRALEAALGVAAKIDFQPEQPGDVPRTCGSTAKAGRLLGYEPRTAFVDGIRKFADWLLGEEMARAGPTARAASAFAG